MKTIACLLSLIMSSCLSAQTKPAINVKAERFKIAAEMQKTITTELLNKWYPHSVDSLYGGFISTYTVDFKPIGTQDKFIVTQARHTWSTAKASELYRDKKYYIKNSKHGFEFLRDVMWDKTYGGFYNMVNRKGEVINGRVPKEAYGNAFAIYALAAYYKASHDTGALSLAKKGFLWLEKYSHDPEHKGYYQHFYNDGSLIKRTATTPANSDIGYKGQNSSIHLLEAFTELYSVWPDALVRERLQEMLHIIRDKIITKQGYLVLNLKPDWTPVSFRDSSETLIRRYKSLDHVSFGHDVETAYLMLEASHALGIKNDKETLAVGKRMVDHALKNGWDKKVGGFYDEGYFFKGRDTITILSRSKNWWAQSEGMNTLLLMADLFPTDPMNYYQRFKEMWTYIQTYLIDHENGDLFEWGTDIDPEKRTGLKGHIWKATYHQFRAFANCVKRLQGNGVKDFKE